MLDKIVFEIRNKNIYRLLNYCFDIIGINQFQIIIYFHINRNIYLILYEFLYEIYILMIIF